MVLWQGVRAGKAARPIHAAAVEPMCNAQPGAMLLASAATEVSTESSSTLQLLCIESDRLYRVQIPDQAFLDL